NILVDSLAYVKRVDDEQARLATEASTADKIHTLMDHIKHHRELLYLLAVFHQQCSKAGIAPGSSRQQSWRFYWVYMTQLKPLHDSFWELCRLVEIANHPHRLRWDVRDVGLLDPNNFDPEVYAQLQTGRFEGVDFRDVQ
ncbi:uncharacterized protein CANTADRAFT_29545, partial [Suhomyces tanzawaensis NRRL Y-17324]